MEPTKELLDQLWRDKVEAARQTPPDQKLLAGPMLYDDLIQIMTAGIRAQFPGASDEVVQRELDRRLDIADRLEGRRWKPTEASSR